MDIADDDPDFTCLKAKLLPLLRPGATAHEFVYAMVKIVRRVNRIYMEAYFIINMHAVRMSKKGKLVVINQTLLYRCLSLNAGDDLDLKETIEQYKRLRPKDYQETDHALLSLLLSTVAKQMEVMCKNHIVENFAERLIGFIRVKHELTKKEAMQFIYGAFQDGAAVDQVELKEWLDNKHPMFKDNIKDNLPFFLQRLYEIMKYMEQLPPNTKNQKLFSLLPEKPDFVFSHVAICRSHMVQFVRHVENEQVVLNALLDLCKADMSNPELEEAPLAFEAHDLVSKAHLDGKFNTELLKQHWVRDGLWRVFINFEQFETANRKFRYHLSSNGYEASLGFKRKPQVTKKEKRARLDLDEVDLYDTFIGIDPGRTFLYTAYSISKEHPVSPPLSIEEFEQGSQEEEVAANTWKEREVEYEKRCLGKPSEGVDARIKPPVSNLSNAEYKHRSQQKAAKKWNERLKKREAKYAEYCREMPSLKTVDFERLKASIKHRLEKMDWMFNFCEEKCFRKWRFKTYRFRQKTMAWACQRLTKGLGRVCIGLGDWGQQKGMKGGALAPVKSFKRELKRYAKRVVDIDEFRTSQTCSCCHGQVNKTVWAKRKKKMKKLKQAAGASAAEEDEVKPGYVHQIVRCESNECAMWWQRDINASRNILELLMRELRGLDRPAAMSRKKTTPSDSNVLLLSA
jgi:hypothetical protein